MIDATRPEPIPVTVTFLMMEKPPAHSPPLPYNRTVALLRTRSMPLHFYRYMLDRIGRKWHWVNALRLPDGELAERLAQPERDIRVLYLDGTPVGLFEVAPHEPDMAEIVYIGLVEGATGQGLGRWLLGQAQQAAWALNPSRVILQTCTLDHPSALPLYQKMGFVPVAQAAETVHPLSLAERAEILVRP